MFGDGERVNITMNPFSTDGATGRLNVLWLTAWYPDAQQPGLGIFVREHAKAVRLYDHVVVIHLAGWDACLRRAWEMERVEDTALTEGIPTYRLRYRLSPLPGTTSVVRFWSVWQAYRALAARGFRPDVIHAHIHSAALPAVLLGNMHRLPVVVTEHSSAFPRKLLSRLHVFEARLAFRWACKVLPVSRALQRGIEDYGIRADFHVIPNVVDTSLFRPHGCMRHAPGPKRLLWVGGMPATHIKGMPHLLDALAHLRQQRDDWHLDIVGDGPMRDVYAQRVQQLHLADRVTFHGFKTKAEVAGFMQRAHLFVLPSLWDNMPCVILEAMATGLPIVSTRTGGISDMVDDKTGILAEPGDSWSLFRVLGRMLATFERFDRTYIVQKARQYGYEPVGLAYHNVYEDCR